MPPPPHRSNVLPEVVSGDVIECTVDRPPASREAAMDLAWHQYAYCMDIVIQGTQTVDELAAILMYSPYWFFWWD